MNLTPSWHIGRAVTGHATSAITGDPIVTLDLYCVGLDRPGVFSLAPSAARDLAAMLVDSADRAEM